MPRIEPGAVGWEAWMILLCYAAPPDANTYRELHHEGVDDAANDGDEVEGVPGVLEVALKLSRC